MKEVVAAIQTDPEKVQETLAELLTPPKRRKYGRNYQSHLSSQQQLVTGDFDAFVPTEAQTTVAAVEMGIQRAEEIITMLADASDEATAEARQLKMKAVLQTIEDYGCLLYTSPSPRDS